MFAYCLHFFVKKKVRVGGADLEDLVYCVGEKVLPFVLGYKAAHLGEQLFSHYHTLN